MHISRSFIYVGLYLALASCGAAALSSESSRALRTTAKVVYYHPAFGAGPTVITRADGSVLDERRYEPFGAAIGAIDFALDPHNALNKETDATTGWSDHGARWLAPETARWLTPDPPVKAPDPKFMAQPWALHPYQYVEQNPVLFWDPDGREPKSVNVCEPEPEPQPEHHSLGAKIMHGVHTGVAIEHAAASSAALADKVVHSTRLHKAAHGAERLGKGASGVLAGGHFIAWMASEPGSKENAEHAGATFVNGIMIIAPPWVTLGLAAIELIFPGFNEWVGRPVKLPWVEERRAQERATQARMEAKLDTLSANFDLWLQANPLPNTSQGEAPPKYGPEPPPKYGPPAPERVSRPDPDDP
jgi:RHS repeat-associated protein